MATKEAKAAEATLEPVFEGDIQTQEAIRVDRGGGAVRAILKKIIMEKLGLMGNFLSAATGEVGPGKSVLLMGAAEVVGHLQVNKSGTTGFEVVVDDGSEATVDAATEAFLTLKQAQFERGELDLTGSLSAEDFMELGAEDFERIEQRLKG